MKKRIFSAVIVLMASCVPGLAQQTQPDVTLPQITVSGSAFVEVKPDLAILHLGIVNEKSTAAEAMSATARSANSVIDTLKSLGVDSKDIKTTSLTLSPVMDERRDAKTNAVIKRTVTGYRASNLLDVRIEDVDKAGKIASSIVEAGANTYYGLNYLVSTREDFEDTLRTKAVGNAMRKAALYAHGALAKLGRLPAIDTEPGGGGVADLAVRGANNGPRAAVVPIEPGMTRIEVAVSATWELVPE